MISLDNADKRKGVIDALILLKKLGQGPIYVQPGDDEGDLKMPQKLDQTNIIDVSNDPKMNTKKYDELNMGPDAMAQKIASQAGLDDSDRLAGIANSVLDTIKRKKAEAERQKAEDEERIRSLSRVKGFDIFKQDLYDAALDQETQEIRKFSDYSKPNKNTGNTGLLRKTTYQEVERGQIPTFNVLVDRSGSMTGDKSDKVERALKFLYDEEEEGRLVINEYWFADNFGRHGDDVGGGTPLWPLAAFVDRCIEDEAQNVIIFTDDDWETGLKWGYNEYKYEKCSEDKTTLLGERVSFPPKYLTVPGCVFLVWLDGETSPSVKKVIKAEERANLREYELL